MIPKLVTASAYHKECDEVVWNAFRDENQEAFAVIYYRYFTILLQRGLQICGDRELVKDCIHDLFVEIWKNKLHLSTPDSVKAYLVACIQRKLLRQLKQIRSRYSESKSTAVELDLSMEDKLIAEQLQVEQKCSIHKALDSLTKRQKEAIQLKYFANLSYEEIAEKMDISTDSIYNLVSKAMDSLQYEFSKEAEPKLL
jgi:RNA polymerase sigma factor (sigma-70 family)